MASNPEFRGGEAHDAHRPFDAGGGSFGPTKDGRNPEIKGVVPTPTNRSTQDMQPTWHRNYHDTTWGKPDPAVSGPAIEMIRGNKIVGTVQYSAGLPRDQHDLGTYIVVSGESLPGDEKDVKAQKGEFTVSVVRMRVGHEDLDNPTTEPTVITHEEVIAQGASTTALEAISEAKRILGKRDKEAYKMDGHYYMPTIEPEERNTLTPEELQAERQRALDAIVITDNEHVTQQPVDEVIVHSFNDRIIGVQTVSFGSDDPSDKTLYTYLEAYTPTISPTDIAAWFDRPLYSVDYVTVSQGAAAEDGGEPQVVEVRESLLRNAPATNITTALEMGRQIEQRLSADVRAFGKQLDNPAEKDTDM